MLTVGPRQMTSQPQPAGGNGHERVPILVVDDQPLNLDAIDAVLSDSGCHLVRAQSADEALLALLERDFAAIVLDIKMPGMNGIDLADLIKARPRSRHVPILFLTAHLFNESRMAASSSITRMRGFIRKSVDYTGLGGQEQGSGIGDRGSGNRPFEIRDS